MALAACAGLIGLLLVVRVLGRPTVQFASDLWDWAEEQGVVSKLVYIAAWILFMPAMLAFCVAGGLVPQIAERSHSRQNN